MQTCRAICTIAFLGGMASSSKGTAALLRLGGGSNSSAYLIGSAASLLWATHVMVGWAFSHAVSPIEFLFWRWCIASAFMLALFWSRLRADIPALLAAGPRLLLLAMFGSVGSNGLGYLALRYTTPTNVAILSSSMPIMVLALQMALGEKRPSLLSVAGIAVSTLGVVVVCTKGDADGLRQLRLGAGELLAILSNLSWALYSVLAPRLKPDVSQRSFILGIALGGSLICAPLLLLQASTGTLMDANLPNIAAVTYAGIGVSVFGYLAYNVALGQLGPRAASLFMHLIPFLTALLAATFFAIYPSAYQALGLAAILFGVVMAMIAEKRDAKI